MSSVGDLRVPATVAIVLAPQLLSLLRIVIVVCQHAAPHRRLPRQWWMCYKKTKGSCERSLK